MVKAPISATISKDVIKWIEKELKTSHRYRNKSHLIEVALELLKREGEK